MEKQHTQRDRVEASLRRTKREMLAFNKNRKRHTENHTKNEQSVINNGYILGVTI